MKYKILKRSLERVHGDPSWLIPDYSYQDTGFIETQAPIQKGDIVNDKIVVEVKHTDNESFIVING